MNECVSFINCVYYCAECRLIKVDDLISAAAAAAASTQPPSTSSSTVFVLTPEHRRRRSLYIEQQRQLQQEELGISAKRDDQLLKLVTVSQLTRPAVSQFLHRELQSLLIGEDVGLVVYHVVGTLKHALESVQRKDQSSNKRGLASASAIEVVAVAAQPYLHQIGHARQLGVELIAFTVSGLNVEAYDAVIFPGIENNNITTGGDGSDDDDDDGRAEVEVEPSSDPTLQI